LITPDIILEKVKEKMLLVPKYIEKNKGLW
jgi:hypothetical protein